MFYVYQVNNCRGAFFMPEDDAATIIHLKHFYLTKAHPNKSIFYIDPKHVHPIDLSIDHLYYGQQHWHAVHMLLEHGDQQHWVLRDLKLSAKHYHIQARGAWWFYEKRMMTNLKGVMRFDHLSHLLAPRPIAHVVDSRWGALHFDLRWLKAPYQLTIAQATGNLALQLHDGKITHLNRTTKEKIRLGKLLSILSLQTLPRRLTLDFSDLSHQGFNFDKFDGNFHLKQGQLSIDHAALESTIAYVQLLGSVDLIKKLYHLELRITPYVTASLPIVATLAGGPVVGVITWLANKLITHEMRKIFCVYLSFGWPMAITAYRASKFRNEKIISS